MTDIRLEEWRPCDSSVNADLDELARVLHAVVHAGAAVNFILPFPIGEARAFWSDKVLPAVHTKKRRVLLLRKGAGIVGTVQLGLDMPPNQVHRADVMKLMVDPELQQQGFGRRLMREIESLAREENRTLLTLDTRTGDKGEKLYRSLGYVCVGAIPSYSKHPASDHLESATFFYKLL